MQDTKGKKHRSSFNINIYIPYIILVCLILVMNLNQPGLVNFRWLNRQADSWVTLALVGIGQTLVFMIGGTDLSVGGIICFTNCLAAVYMPESVPGMVAISIGVIVIGALAGAFNGFIIVKFNLQPFIATLATWAIWYGAALCLLSTDGGKVHRHLVSFSSEAFRIWVGLGYLC